MKQNYAFDVVVKIKTFYNVFASKSMNEMGLFTRTAKFIGLFKIITGI